jgi:hypothetical protein
MSVDQFRHEYFPIPHLHQAFALLSSRFLAARKNHIDNSNGELAGFLQDAR